MPLDELKDLWTSQAAVLEGSLKVDERILHDTLVRKARWAVVPGAVMRGIEIAVGVAFVAAVVPVLLARSMEPLYVWLGGAVVLCALALIARGGYLLVGAMVVDWSAPVADVQRSLEHLRVAEAVSTVAAVLAGTLLWLPAALILVEALGGPAALTRVDRPWLVANLVFGVVVLGVGCVWARRFTGRDGGARALADVLSGRSLRRARASFDEMAGLRED